MKNNKRIEITYSTKLKKCLEEDYENIFWTDSDIDSWARIFIEDGVRDSLTYIQLFWNLTDEQINYLKKQAYLALH
ncbi:MAG: hypothetical protein LBC39_02715 [Methanobrevibacter sp.]|jgi:hypothetical protein|nr:hypothetical protein [Candidatus Methanovirga aequatorialis]